MPQLNIYEWAQVVEALLIIVAFPFYFRSRQVTQPIRLFWLGLFLDAIGLLCFNLVRWQVLGLILLFVGVLINTVGAFLFVRDTLRTQRNLKDA